MSCSSDSLTIHVIGLDGLVWSPQVKSCLSIGNLKRMAVSHFCSTKLQKQLQNGSTFSLMSVSKKMLLNEGITVAEEGLADNDELILLESRHPLPTPNLSEENLRGPTATEIAEATKHLEKQTYVQPQLPNDEVIDVQNEVQRILISLIEAAARLLSPSPDGMKIFNLLNEKIKKRGRPTLGNASVKQLTDMGFPQPRALKALKINMMNVSAATEWLLQHESDSDDDDDQPSTSVATPQNTVEAFHGLVQSLLTAKTRQFQPHPRYLQNLKDMGFLEKDVKEALKITGNNQGAACTWLLGDRKRGTCNESEQGLDHNGPLYKAIMKNPVIQMNLTNPKVLFAFLSIVENSTAADLWMNDDDTSPVLIQIFKTYHTEKLTTKPLSDDMNGTEESSEDSVTSHVSSNVDYADDEDDLYDEEDDETE